jgi:hypothetical protein
MTKKEVPDIIEAKTRISNDSSKHDSINEHVTLSSTVKPESKKKK